jgi:hypothetical protein
VKRMYWLQIPKHYDINKKNEKWILEKWTQWHTHYQP